MLDATCDDILNFSLILIEPFGECTRPLLCCTSFSQTVPQGAGALYSTTEDLLKWELAMFGGKVLKPASFEKMTTPVKNNWVWLLWNDVPDNWV